MQIFRDKVKFQSCWWLKMTYSMFDFDYHNFIFFWYNWWLNPIKCLDFIS